MILATCYRINWQLENQMTKRKSPLAHTKNQAINGFLEMEKNMDAILLESEEINSTIDKYLNNLESDDE